MSYDNSALPCSLGTLYYIALLFQVVIPEVFSNLVLLGKIILQCDMNMPHPSVQSIQGHARTERRT